MWIILFLLTFIVGNTQQQHFVLNVHWNKSNPIFASESGQNIIDIDTRGYPGRIAQVNVICPFYSSPTVDPERYIIYNVSRSEYDDCQVLSLRTVAVCDSPFEPTFVTLTFRPFSPTPGGWEFKPGKDYYFISTSSKWDIGQKIGGMCSTHNMRLMFRIADEQKEQRKVSTTASPSVDVEQQQSGTNRPKLSYLLIALINAVICLSKMF